METNDEQFFWGAATAAHQVEGGNHNDWTEWEEKNAERLASHAQRREFPWYILEHHPNPHHKENYISGRAADHYNRYEEDFNIAKSLGHNAHRFSIEWSRIEPLKGRFNQHEVEHYRKVIKALRVRGLEPFVTLWHWTLPVWLRDEGGILSPHFSEYFEKFSSYIISQFKDDVTYWITLNEPTSVILNSYYWGKWPPQKRGFISALRAFRALARAHTYAYKNIHEIQKGAKVGFVNIIPFIEAYNRNPFHQLAAFYREFWSNKVFPFLVRKSIGDFIAFDYYFHFKMKFPGRVANKNESVSDMGWEIYPEGIYHILKNLKKYNLPVYITENGLADARDEHRAKFIRDHIAWMKKAIDEGVDVRGYFHWSLLDNFEWDSGFWPRFGLVEIDYRTMERKVRKSALEYKQIIQESFKE